MKLFLRLTILVATFLSLTSSSIIITNEINPTGTYSYDDGENGNGTIKVKKINSTKIKLSVFVVGGGPSAHMGEFIHEMNLKNNLAYYKTADCKFKFSFNSKSVTVTQTGFYNGFGAGISADGYYKKTSNKVPKITSNY